MIIILYLIFNTAKIVCARSVQYKMFISWKKFNHNT